MLPRPHSPGSARRTIRRLAVSACAVALVIGLSGCPFFLFGMDQLPELLFYDEFDHIDQDDWEFGTESGMEPNAQTIAGTLFVFGPRHFLKTRRTFGGDFTVRLEWSVLTHDPPIELADIDGPDFRVTIESRRATVGLELYRWRDTPVSVYPVPDFYDTLWIRDEDGNDIVPPVAIPTWSPLPVRTGRLDVRFTASGSMSGVWTEVPELGLLNEAPLPQGGLFDVTRITLGVSGLVIPTGDGPVEHPRALEELYVSRWFE